MTNLDSVLKSREITLPTNVPMDKTMVFSVVTCRCKVVSERRLNTKELMLLNYGAGEDFSESFGLQGDQTSQY